MNTGAPQDQAERPQALGAEASLLGAILHNPAAIDGVRHIVEPSDFYSEVNGWLYEAMCRRRDAGEHVDFRLLTTILGNRDLGGETVGKYLGRLATEATTVINAPSYAKAVREASRMRRLFETAIAAQAAMTTGGVADPAGYAAQMIEDLDEIATAAMPDHMRRVAIGRSALGVIERVQEARAPLKAPGRL